MIPKIFNTAYESLEEFYEQYDRLHESSKTAIIKTEFLFGPPKGALLEFQRSDIRFIHNPDLKINYATWDLEMSLDGVLRTKLTINAFYDLANRPDIVLH